MDASNGLEKITLLERRVVQIRNCVSRDRQFETSFAVTDVIRCYKIDNADPHRRIGVGHKENVRRLARANQLTAEQQAHKYRAARQ